MHPSTKLWRKNGNEVQSTVDFETTLGIMALAGKRDLVYADYQRVREIEQQLVIEKM